MKNPNKTLVFFGNERIATGVTTNTPVLRELIEAGYTIAAIIVNQTEQESGRKRDLEVAALAKEHQIPLLSPLKPVEIANQLTAYKADAAVLVAYGKIIPQSVIDIFPSGIINVHPSLLPKYRGSTPIESAILNGDSETGVTIMRLTSTMDAGPIYAQSIVALKSDQNKQQLADELSDIGAKMIRSLLPDILDGSLTAINQDDENATYSTLLNKKNGIIDWQDSATDIERQVRAYALWPKSRATIGSIDCAVTKAGANEQQIEIGKTHITAEKTVLVGCGQGSLEIIELQPAGKNIMPVGAFLNGYRHLL